MYSPDLRKLTEDQKLERGASQAGVSLEEWMSLSPSERTLFSVAATKENVYARGFTKAALKRILSRWPEFADRCDWSKFKPLA